MNRSVRVFQVDAFTRQPFTGNPAGVVLDAERLDTAQMQNIARELNNGDTAFVLPPDGPDHDLRVRFFTPRSEASFVGHATLAVHAVRDALGLPACQRQKQRSGVVTIETQHDAGRGATFAFTQPPPPLRGALGVELRSPLLAALGLSPEDLDERCPPTIAGEHNTRALIAVREAAMLERLQPDQAALAALSARGAPPGSFVFTLRPAAPGVLSEARMFCPALGIPEDPVSGNAHAMLAALLWREKLLPATAQGEFTAHQGRFMGRPGQLSVRLLSGTAAAGPPVLSQISVGGSAVLVFATTIALPGLAA